MRRRHRVTQDSGGGGSPLPEEANGKALLWTENLAGRLPKAVAATALSSKFVVS